MLYLNYLLASFFLKHIIRPGSELFSTNQKNNEVIIKSSTWRLFNVEVPHDLDPGKNDVLPHSSLISAVIDALPLKRIPFNITNEDVTVVKKAFDGRWKKSGQPKWVYTIDLAIPKTLKQKFSIKEVKGRIEKVLSPRSTDSTDINKDTSPLIITGLTSSSKPSDIKIVVVGAGPSGLFAAIRLVEAGYKPIIIERGEPVEVRGRDIGALFNRKILNGESNLCYGEGGAGTWSDGKLTTRIGKNSDVVRYVLLL